MIDASSAHDWMLRICAVGLTVDTFEQITRRRDFADPGLYSWTIVRRRLDRAPAWLTRLADVLCAGWKRPVLVLSLRLPALALVLSMRTGSAPFALALSLLVAIQLYHFLRRGGLGLLASDQMNLILLGATWLSTVLTRAPSAGLAFMSAQLCLSYFVNGAAKLAAPAWRSGRALQAIFSTASFGGPALSRLVTETPRLARVASWATIAWECGFPLILIVPAPVRLGFLAAGIMFHAITAVTMGLNQFLWAFPAAYPAIWYIASMTGSN